MRTTGALPKSVLILEMVGMVLLALALLSLNHYLTLPEPFNSSLAVIVMLFFGRTVDDPRRAGVRLASRAAAGTTVDEAPIRFIPFRQR